MNIRHLLDGIFGLPVIITTPLVPPLPADGQIGDAVPLSATINYIVSQVNANAQPLTTTPTAIEWQPLGQTPTFISATSFSVPGNVTPTLPVARRIQTTNTGGTIYSTISVSSFGGGITTLTVINDSGVLDAGLSVVNYGILNSTNVSRPSPSLYVANWAHNAEAFSTGVTKVLSTGNGFTYNAVTGLNNPLGEFNSATGVFTALRTGVYFVTCVASTTTGGVTYSGNSSLGWSGTGAASLPLGFLSLGVAGSSVVYAVASGLVLLTAAQTLSAQLLLTFGAGAPVLNSAQMAIFGPL